MPILTNERHELFAQELAKGKSATEAYVLAGFKPSRKNASRLRANEDIAGRVGEIQAVAAKATEITIETVCRELDDAIAVARSKGAAHAMVSAAGLRAKLAGLMIERHEVGITHNYTKQGASPDEILQAFWHSCTINCPDIEITDEDREWLAAILKALRQLEDRMIGREMRRVIEQDRQARILSDGQRLFSTGLFNEKGRPHG